jgi:hypothetical protein
VLGDDGSCKQAVASVLADRVCDGKAANSVNTGPYWDDENYQLFTDLSSTKWYGFCSI